MTMAISANLDTNDTLYTSGVFSTYRINETIVRTYPDSVRDTNHLNMTMTWISNETQLFTVVNLYWDKSTGIIVEESFEARNQTGDYLTTWSGLMGITDSKKWVVPEFSTLTSILLVFIVITTAIGIYKRRILKALIQ